MSDAETAEATRDAVPTGIRINCFKGPLRVHKGMMSKEFVHTSASRTQTYALEHTAGEYGLLIDRLIKSY